FAGAAFPGVIAIGVVNRLASYVTKKCSAFWMIGPPNANPNSLSFEGVLMFGFEASSEGVSARKFWPVEVPKTSPSNLLVPDLVSAVPAALELWSYSALYLEVITLLSPL